MRGKQRWMCRFCWVSVFVGFHLLTILQCSYSHRKVPQRKSRQTVEADETVDGIPGVWSSWGPWSPCSSSCGIGIMEQSRRCMPQEPGGQRWAHQPRGPYSQPRPPYGEDRRIPYPGGAVSALKPAYPLHVNREPLTYPHEQSVPLQAQQELGSRRGGHGPNQHSVPLYGNEYSSNQPEFPVYRQGHPTNGESAPRQGYRHLSNQGLLPLYRRGQPSNHDRQRLPANRDSPSPYGAQSLTNRESSPLYAHEGSSNQGSGSQPRQRSATNWRVSTGNRRSLLMREELRSSNRSHARGTIRPGQYGYGKVPSTFQLHGGMAHLQQETGRDRQGQQSSSWLPRLSEGAAAQTAPQDKPGARQEPENGRQARRGARAAQEENRAWQGFEIQAQAAHQLSGSQASGLQASGSIKGHVGVQKGLWAPPEWGQQPGELAAEEASRKTQHRGSAGAGTEQQQRSVDGVLDGPNHTSVARQPNPARGVEVVASSQPARQVPEEPAGDVPSRGGSQASPTRQRPKGHERALQDLNFTSRGHIGHMFGYLAPDNGESRARGLLEISDEYSYQDPAQRQAKHESNPQTRLRHRSPRLGPQSEPQRTQQEETTGRKIEQQVPQGQRFPADPLRGGTITRARSLPPAYGSSTKPGRQSQPEAPHPASSRGSHSAPKSPRHRAPQKVHREDFQSPHRSFRRAQHTHLSGGVQAPETQASAGRRLRRQDYGVGTYPGADIHDQDWNPHQWPTTACPGGERQYKTCTSSACPSSALDPRKAQCARFNHLQFMGRYYEWEPFTEVRKDQRCELNCRPTGYRFYVRQADRVSDGTPCEANSTDVCVGGSCLTPGCDGTLGSGTRPDKCGECGGDGSSCELVFGTFEDSQVNVGYHKIIEIPTGATKINVTEMARSRNYLALRSRSGRSIINGNWAIDRPGKYEAAGTMFLYKRPTELRGESFVAEGPTTESLDVFMIFQQENPGIHYEFVLPVEKPADPQQNSHYPGQGYGARPAGEPMEVPVLGSSPVVVQQRSHVVPRARVGQRDRRLQVYHTETQEEPVQTQPVYRWKSQSATECSASCGKGFQYPIFRCVAQNTQEVVPDSQCDSASKPASPGKACNTQPCPAFWSLSAWSECSKTCGPGIHHRQVLCRQAYANRTVTVHPHRCGHLEKPNATQPCQARLCTRWQIQTDWESCSVPCGVGQRKRGIRCVSNQGDVVGEGQCNGKHRPTDSETCDMGPCVKTWFYTDWSSKCSVECGVGVQKRSVLCLTNHINDRSAESCEGTKPPETRACARGRCERQVRWYTSPWNQCPVQCGNGTQNRDLICVIKLGTDFTVTVPSDCAHLDKPSSVQPCSAGPCGARWFNTAWSECSKSCLGGVQVREVRCLDDGGFPSSLCDVTGKLADQRMCNTHPCSPELDENCKDKYYNCPVVVQARLCVYSYYKMVCCASCTHAERRSSDLRRHEASARRGAA